MCLFNRCILQHDMLHAQRMQTFMHVRDRICGLISCRPTRIENPVQIRRVHMRRKSAQCERERKTAGDVSSDEHNRNIICFYLYWKIIRILLTCVLGPYIFCSAVPEFR